MATTTAQSPLDTFDPTMLAALGTLELKARYFVEGFLHGIHPSPFHGFSVEFSEYRDYQPGDDLRHLDWRVYARSDRLVVKKFEAETNTSIYLLCDTSGSMAYGGRAAWSSKHGCMQMLSVALAWLMLHQNDAVGLLGLEPDGEAAIYLPPSQKPNQFSLLLQHAEGLESAGGERLARLLQRAGQIIRHRSILVLLSDLLEPADQLADAWKELRFRGHECLVFQILDRDEIDFPFEDPAIFEDLETASRHRVSPRAARARYLERFGAFMQQHARLLEDLEIPRVLVRTDGNPWEALAQYLIERRQLV
jgi:uncharacterized protein (DUF58 family)